MTNKTVPETDEERIIWAGYDGLDEDDVQEALDELIKGGERDG